MKLSISQRKRDVMRYESRKTTKLVLGNGGFTLIELAIVLIIIGIIIGAVVKGKDLIRGGEQKKIYTKFISEWRTAYLNFYDRTGRVLGDTNGDGRADSNPSNNGSIPSGKAHEMMLAFDFDTREKYNYMQIVNIPNELCMAMDTMIDGEADGTKGDFIGDGGDGQAWGGSPTAVNTARWKMEF